MRRTNHALSPREEGGAAAPGEGASTVCGRRRLPRIVLPGLLVALVLAAPLGEAHKPVTSKYTYTEDVFPIFSGRCGTCHVAAGVAPMSLMTYREAMPWAESIRAEIIAANMPPWHAETGYGLVKNPHLLSPREIDILLTWATGGAPEGPTRKLLSAGSGNDWKLNSPDMALPLLEPFTLGADTMEETRDFVVHAGGTADTWIKAIDLKPGSAAMVRNAIVYTRERDSNSENVLAVWLPGDDPVIAGEGAAFRWRAGTQLALRIHYRKTWKYEGKALTDRSAIGLYLAEGPLGREMRTLRVTPPLQTIDQDVRALALRLAGGPPESAVSVEAIRPDGSRLPMIRLKIRQGWERRYWFEEPQSLPRGTRINIVLSSTGAAEPPPELWMDVVSP